LAEAVSKETSDGQFDELAIAFLVLDLTERIDRSGTKILLSLQRKHFVAWKRSDAVMRAKTALSVSACSSAIGFGTPKILTTRLRL